MGKQNYSLFCFSLGWDSILFHLKGKLLFLYYIYIIKFFISPENRRILFFHTTINLGTRTGLDLQNRRFAWIAKMLKFSAVKGCFLVIVIL
jgi:hypothetical protein